MIEIISTPATNETMLQFGKAAEIIDAFGTMDYYNMLPTLCMMIDTAAALHGKNAVEIAKQIYDLVKMVNDEIGEYRIYEE